MSVVQRISDGLVNIVANLGTGRDKAAHTKYYAECLAPSELLSIYRSSWLAAAMVNYPAEDATRKWRFWRAEADQISKIEALEKKLGLKSLVQDALVAARLYGGSAIYINVAGQDQTEPLVPGKEIRSLVVLSRHNLSAEATVRDIESPYYGRPEFYTLSTQGDPTPVRIHASRLVVFLGVKLPGDPHVANQGWGDSVLQATIEAVRQTDSTMANIASLVFEAKIDVLKFEGFADMLAANKDAAVTRRLQSQAAMKGINGAVVIDMKDDYQQKNASFSGLTEVAAKFQENAAGAAKMPVTRIYGRAAAGLSGSGDGDERVYFDRIGHEQATSMAPALAMLDECIITQALGRRPPEIYYEWAPLRQLTEEERADIFVKTATAARSIAGTNAGELIPLYALSDSLVNELIEQGVLPGLEQAIKTYGTLAEEDVLIEGQTAPALPVGDAAPMTLYVSRRVTNAAAILKHYADQGVKGLLAASDMHVTVTYSRNPVNWMEMGESWNSDITVPAGGARISEAFGPEKDTLVLSFVSSDLTWRHEAMVEKGATWDWPDYQPHVSISYDFDGDAESIDPWRGEITLGPEIFEQLDEDWRSGV